ncbi:hypothetical protein SISSUDRAFT_431610 [Sistotremastrum suecicum HHB10207 ss-3]|uniref:Uncharacterized protein n=1 Tax=Sistotremastrum suecicum HHB10207 ss-3 TaxID=1314776 RepID=A0A165YHF2_9AGAM|nr:hypothetical protein SISSUDRAFT_431610 [Sistotremastrum suecicum HHB10207 ss-3]
MHGSSSWAKARSADLRTLVAISRVFYYIPPYYIPPGMILGIVDAVPNSPEHPLLVVVPAAVAEYFI